MVMDLIQVLVHKQVAKLELPTLVVVAEVDRVIIPVVQEVEVVKVALV